MILRSIHLLLGYLVIIDPVFVIWTMALECCPAPVHRSGSWINDPVQNMNAGSLSNCSFDPSGKLLVGGSVRNGSGALLQPLTGLYQQSQFNPDVNGGATEFKDPVLLAFGTTNERLYGSYFGGEAHAAFREMIHTVLHRRENGNVYFAGTTSKEADPLSYFPLDDGGGTPYFEENWQGGTYEGFLAAICSGALNEVGVAERDHPGTNIISHWSNNELRVFDLPSGAYQYEVHDALGQCIARNSFSSDGHTTQIALPTLAQGAYVMRLGVYVAKFIVTR